MRGFYGTDLAMNEKGTIPDSIDDAAGDEIFVVSTISSVRKKVPGRDNRIEVFSLRETFKIDKKVSYTYPNR